MRPGGHDLQPAARPRRGTAQRLSDLITNSRGPLVMEVRTGSGIPASAAGCRARYWRGGSGGSAPRGQGSRDRLAPGMVELMRRRFAAEGLDARAEVMDGQALGVEDESFDLGTSTFGLIFSPDPLVGLRELRRVLRVDGRVGIASWDMMRIGLPQLIGAALARVVPDLPAPPPSPWAHLGEATAGAVGRAELTLTRANSGSLTRQREAHRITDSPACRSSYTKGRRHRFPS